MKAYHISKTNKIQDLILKETGSLPVKTDEIRVKLKAIGLNPVDYKIIEGAFNLPAGHIPGVDGAGEIVEIGSDVKNLNLGNRVVFHSNLKKAGTFAEEIVVPAHVVSKIPQSISYEQAASIPCAGYTAYQAIVRKIHLSSEDAILINGGSGGVGSFGIQIAKTIGAKVISSCSESKMDYVKSLNCDCVIDYNTANLNSELLRFTNEEGVDAVLDAVSGKSASESLRNLRFNGRIAFIAGAPDYSLIRPFSKALSFHEIALGGAYLSDDLKAQKDLAKMGDEILELLTKEKMKFPEITGYPFEKLPEALMNLKEGKHQGKVVVLVD
ncbi:MAG: zinc-binding dehydrogenase [Cytophagales bacterium]|nr:zinc-binding dehydrogenase [Cytophagales bacterium]